ncbi:tripartite tricarboxylate transporter substrate binding protein [Delftia sp. PS-11]|uniref:tripartite tricarboxylate transporter substrate binding protein n=1 Tax=Delftia sp. PS-11 TaxID=2767222 RepID=UPI002462BF66|nr:tripartite tricarboxylate transporter substrate binding protein [Delftia sp. PS-11]
MRAAVALAAAVLCAAPAQAQEWPKARPIRIVVPNPPAGPSDISLRPVAAAMQAALGQAVVVDNRPGANGNIGAAEVARSAPDGYTWLWTMDAVLTVNPHVYRSLGYKADALEPLVVAARFSQTLVCGPATGLKTVRDMIAASKTRELTYASGGAGSPGHLVMESLLATAGAKMVHVPYKGPAPAMQDLLGGQVDCGFLAGPTVLPQVQGGKLLALATSGKTRSALAPELPTIAESGFPEFDGTFSILLAAPRGVPAAVQQRFIEAMNEAIRAPAQKERARAQDIEMVGSTVAEAQARTRALSAQWGALVRKIQLTSD